MRKRERQTDKQTDRQRHRERESRSDTEKEKQNKTNKPKRVGLPNKTLNVLTSVQDSFVFGVYTRTAKDKQNKV